MSGAVAAALRLYFLNKLISFQCPGNGAAFGDCIYPGVCCFLRQCFSETLAVLGLTLGLELRDQPDSASHMLELKACITTQLFFFLIKK